MAKQEHSAADTTLPCSAGETPTGAAQAGQQSKPLAWPLTFLDDAILEASRIGFPLSRSVPYGGPSKTAKAAAQIPLMAMEEESIEPPTSIDRLLHASMARYTLGVSPLALWLAYADWAIHFWGSPGKSLQLTQKGLRKSVRFLTYLFDLAFRQAPRPCIEPLPQDQRFRSEAWQKLPFNVIYQGFLLHQQWWHNATTGIGGVSKHHEQLVSFMGRQVLDTLSPVNFIGTNPEVFAQTLREGGMNLIRGVMKFWSDWERDLGGKPPAGTDEFRPGERVAVTKGKVVYRNKLIELIQYASATEQVRNESVLIVPAWIMKYYILDLSPDNSLVKYLVDHGYTVFMISWHNPTSADRDLGMDDYLQLGVLDALRAIQTILPDAKVNALGYCLGGTLLSIAAGYLAAENKPLLNSLTLLAAQTDFTDAGELTLFIDDSQLDFLEDIMWAQGYLDNRQMAGTFQLLRSSDLIWSRAVNEYLMGREQPMTDLMAWNADGTRLPYRMHSEYLRRLYLNNDLFEGRYETKGRHVVLSDIRVPIFAVSTETDHVAPWRSVYKINLVIDTDLTFVLTSGGHNAGIISEPGHKGRHYRISHRLPDDGYADPQTWYAKTPVQAGSWWSAWLSWLDQQSTGLSNPPSLGAPSKGYPILSDAPGAYVLER